MKKTAPSAAPRSPFPIILAGILLLAATLRFASLASLPPGLCFDEATNGVNFMEAIETGHWRVFYPDNFGREGLFINLQGLFVALLRLLSNSSSHFIPDPWMLRFPSAVFGLITVAGMYPLALTLTRSRAASAAAAFFLATSFWHVNFSRIGFRAIMAPFFLVWSLWLLFSGCEDILSAQRRRGLWKLAAAGLLYGAGFHSYIAYRATPLILAAAFLWLFFRFHKQNRSTEFFIAAGLFVLMAALAVLPLALYFFSEPSAFFGRAAAVSAFSAPDPAATLLENTWRTALMFNVEGDSFWRHNISGRPQLFLPVGLLFLAGLTWPLWRRRFDPDAPSWPWLLLLIWLLAAALPVIASRHGVPHALRGLLMAPACFLLAGLAFSTIWTLAAARISTGAAATCLGLAAAVLAWECYASYFGAFAKSPGLALAFEIESANLAAETRALPEQAPKFFIVPGAKLDSRGVPQGFNSLALLSGAWSQSARAARNIRFVVTREEAERVSNLEGAYIYVLSSQ